MSTIIGQLDLTPNDDCTLWRLHQSLSYQSDLLGATISIPAGFWTDGASVPKIFWNLIPPFGRYGRGAVIHDYLYRWQHTTRHQADDVLLEAMKVAGCGWLTYSIIWSAVRLLGFFAWRSDAKKPLSADELAPNASVVIKPA